jgi:hypothetical protein
MSEGGHAVGHHPPTHPQLQVFSWKKRKGGMMELVKLVKYDAQTYITSVNVVKNFVVYSDVQKSVHFMRFVVGGLLGPLGCFVCLGRGGGGRSASFALQSSVLSSSHAHVWRACVCELTARWQENHDGSCYLMPLASDFSPMSATATSLMTDGRIDGRADSRCV